MTITRGTKRNSYRITKKTLGERQTQVLNELMLHPDGVTASELALSMWDKGFFVMPDRNNVHPRLNELVELMLVEVTGKRSCSVTNRTVAVYQVKGEI